MTDRIALYTIFRCTNYGAVLQAYALARVLREILGEDAVDVLNHRMDPRDNHLLGKISNPNTPWFQRWRNKRKAVRRYVSPGLFEERRKKTIRFIEEEIRPTAHLYRTPFEFKDMPEYRTVVVGSDQVWNPDLNHDFGMNQYLGECLPENQDRVAYAASFGVSLLPSEMRARYTSALGRFRRITVREETGATLVESLIGQKPEVVLDPTMLLSADAWCKVAGLEARNPNQGIVAYWVRTMAQADMDALGKMAKAKGKQIRLFSAGPMPKLDLPDGIMPCIDASPPEFVKAVACADGVVTDSFHGLMFSTVFRKPVLALGNLGVGLSNASRITDFCNRYGLRDAVADIEAFRRSESVDFADMNLLLKEVLSCDVKKSISYLKNI